MTTITLVQTARSSADHIIQMRLLPGKILITNLEGGPIQFSCENNLTSIKDSTSAEIVYDASISGSTTETIQISSIIS